MTIDTNTIFDDDFVTTNWFDIGNKYRRKYNVKLYDMLFTEHNYMAALAFWTYELYILKSTKPTSMSAHTNAIYYVNGAKSELLFKMNDKFDNKEQEQIIEDCCKELFNKHGIPKEESYDLIMQRL